MKFKIMPVLLAGAMYIGSLALNKGAYTFNYLWAGVRTSEYSIFNEQYWKLAKYQDEVYKESKTRWQFVPGSFLWRLPERPELEPLEFDELDKEKEYKKPMITNGLEKISPDIIYF